MDAMKMILFAALSIFSLVDAISVGTTRSSTLGNEMEQVNLIKSHKIPSVESNEVDFICLVLNS